MEIGGQAFVPVFSSEEQFRQVVGSHLSYTIAPAVEFARGLPPHVGIAVNPDGVVGVPLPPAAVADLCRVGRTPLDGPNTGAGSSSTSRTGRTTRSTSWQPRRPSSRPREWSSRPAAAWPPSKRPTR